MARQVKHWRSWATSYALILPAMAMFLLMAAGPFIGGIWLSLFKLTVREETFIGLANFVHLVQDSVFRRAFLNTLLYVLAIVPVVQGAVILLAVAAHYMTRGGKRFMRTALYIVGMSGGAFTAGFWLWLWYPVASGGLNTVLGKLGIWPVNWVGKPVSAFFVIASCVAFTHLGGQFVLTLAAVDGQPQELHDAARVDGCNAWQDLRYITLPLLRRVALFQLITLSIATAQIWQTLLLLNPSGGPNNATITLGYYQYQTAIMRADYGLGSAVSVVLMGLILGLVLVQNRFMREKP